MLVLVAVALLDQPAGFDPPAMPHPEVAAFMHLGAAQGFAGQPGVLGALDDDLGRVGVHLFSQSCRLLD